MGMWKVHKAQLAKAGVHVRDPKPTDACPQGQWGLATETKLDREGNVPTGRLAHKEGERELGETILELEAVPIAPAIPMALSPHKWRAVGVEWG